MATSNANRAQGSSVSTDSTDKVPVDIIVKNYNGKPLTIERPIVAPPGKKIVGWDKIIFKSELKGSIILSVEARHGNDIQKVATATNQKIKGGVKAQALSQEAGLSIDGSLKDQFDSFIKRSNEHYTFYLIATIAPIKHGVFSGIPDEKANLEAEVLIHLGPENAVSDKHKATPEAAPAKKIAETKQEINKPKDLKDVNPKSQAEETKADFELTGVTGDTNLEQDATSLIEVHLQKFKYSRNFDEQQKIFKDLLNQLAGKRACLTGVKGNLTITGNATAKTDVSAVELQSLNEMCAAVRDEALKVAETQKQSSTKAILEFKKEGIFTQEMAAQEAKKVLDDYKASIDKAQKQYDELMATVKNNPRSSSPAKVSQEGLFGVTNTSQAVAGNPSPAPTVTLVVPAKAKHPA
jgi:hypothetical protein